MKLTDLKVCSLIYQVSRDCINTIFIDENGVSSEQCVASNEAVLPKIEQLKDELRDTVKIAMDKTPLLSQFMKDWGPSLLPIKLIATVPDVLIIIPNSFLHGIPLHLICPNGDQETLSEKCGISYCSSMTLFVQCTKRNSIRTLDLSNWTFDLSGKERPRDCPTPKSFFGGATDVLGDKEDEFKEIVDEVRNFVNKQVSEIENISLTRMLAKTPFRIAGIDVILLMAHGIIDSQNHMHSGLLLSHLKPHQVELKYIWRFSGPYEIRDYPQKMVSKSIGTNGPAEILTTAELALYEELQTRLIILLACSAGWDKVMSGDEPASIAEMYLKIGAPSVVAPNWDSHYPTSKKWIYYFFEGWAVLGLPKAIAVRYAAQKIKEACPDIGYGQTGVLTLRGDWL